VRQILDWDLSGMKLDSIRQTAVADHILTGNG